MIPKTKIHYERLYQQIKHLLINIQRDLVRNAKAHKSMALAQSPDIDTLRKFVDGGVSEHKKHLKDLADLRSTSTKRQDFINILTTIGVNEDDIMNLYTPLKQVIQGIEDAPKETYQDIINLSDTVISMVEPPLTLWEE